MRDAESNEIALLGFHRGGHNTGRPAGNGNVCYRHSTTDTSTRWHCQQTVLRVIDWETLSSAELLQLLESAIQSQFIPAITGQAPPGKQVRELLALPVRLGGLGPQNPINMAKEQHTASQQICAPLVDRNVHQEHLLGECHVVQQSIKARLRSEKHTQQKEEANNLQNQIPSTLKRLTELSQEKGASTWLTSLPIDDHGFACTSLHSGMLSPSGTAGHFRIHPLMIIVPVATHSVQSIH